MDIRRTNDKQGWLLPYLLGLDNMFFKRWEYWTKICISDQILPDPIPMIRFQPPYIYKERQVFKNIRKCLDYTHSVSNPLAAFIDWILWGFNQGEQFPAISEKEDDFWYGPSTWACSTKSRRITGVTWYLSIWATTTRWVSLRHRVMWSK